MMEKVIEPLLEWYSKNKRSLPWREDKNPYHVWVSEIMLQQTRIEAVKKYYHRFMKEIPTINELADIPENDLLKLWEGLGYYNRARNLQKTAQYIVNNYKGIFPNTYGEIIKLPGIGEYTAGAISSICFNEKKSAIDGNVLRVYARIMSYQKNILDIKNKNEVKIEVEKIIPENAGEFNEAIMELGETICLPKKANCSICPLQSYCQSFQLRTVDNLPIRIKNKKKEIEKITVLLLYHNNSFLIEYREKETLLKNLWGFPSVKGHLNGNQINDYLTKIKINSIQKSISNKHIFTHKIWEMESYLVHVKQIDKNDKWVTIKEVEKKYAIPTAYKPFLEVLKEVCR